MDNGPLIGRKVKFWGSARKEDHDLHDGVVLGIFLPSNHRAMIFIEDLETGGTVLKEHVLVRFGFKKEYERYKNSTDYCPMCGTIKKKEEDK